MRGQGIVIGGVVEVGAVFGIALVPHHEQIVQFALGRGGHIGIVPAVDRDDRAVVPRIDGSAIVDIGVVIGLVVEENEARVQAGRIGGVFQGLADGDRGGLLGDEIEGGIIPAFRLDGTDEEAFGGAVADGHEALVGPGEKQDRAAGDITGECSVRIEAAVARGSGLRNRGCLILSGVEGIAGEEEIIRIDGHVVCRARIQVDGGGFGDVMQHGIVGERIEGWRGARGGFRIDVGHIVPGEADGNFRGDRIAVRILEIEIEQGRTEGPGGVTDIIPDLHVGSVGAGRRTNESSGGRDIHDIDAGGQIGDGFAEGGGQPGIREGAGSRIRGQRLSQRQDHIVDEIAVIPGDGGWLL